MAEKSSKPQGKLVPVFAASDNLGQEHITLSLAKAAAARGETVLMLDCQGGSLMDAAGIVYSKTLADVLLKDASIKDVKYVTSNEHFTAAAAGHMTLNLVLGSLAALSLQYDWVFVGTEPGCTPAHVRLAGAADVSLLTYSTDNNRFMRAYWMMEAVRRRFPDFDPLLMSMGPKEDANETALMLIETIKEFLGAPPPYIGHHTDPWIAPKTLVNIRDIAKTSRVA